MPRVCSEASAAVSSARISRQHEQSRVEPSTKTSAVTPLRGGEGTAD